MYMSVVDQIKKAAAESIRELYGLQLEPSEILVNATKPEFEGVYTVVLFAIIKQLKKSPELLGNELGNYIVQHYSTLFNGFNIKSFLFDVIVGTT